MSKKSSPETLQGQQGEQLGAQTQLRPQELADKVREMLGEGPFAALTLMRLSLIAERARRALLSGEHKFSRSMFSLKIFEDVLKLNTETENIHDLLGGASGVWSHETVFEKPLSEGTLPIEVIRLIFQLEKQQRDLQQQLETVFLQMQTQPETPGEIPPNLAFADRFTALSAEKWVNLLGRYNVKPVDLCLLPESQELRPRTPEEMQTIHIILRDKQGKVRSLYHRFSATDSQTHDVAAQVLKLWRSQENIGEPVEHAFFEIEIDLTDASQGSEIATDLLNPSFGAREAIANRAPVCHCKLDHQRVGFHFPHFSNNEDQGWNIARASLHALQTRFRQTDPITKVIDRRVNQEPDGEKLQELELVSGFTFQPEEIAWHAAAIKLFEQPPQPGETTKTKPSFVQLVGMAQGFLTESTTYLCVAAKKAELQLALLPFIGDETKIIDLLKKLKAKRALPATDPGVLSPLETSDKSAIIDEMKRITAFTNRDIADCQSGHGLVAQLYVSTNEMSKSLFSQLFPNMHGQIQKGPAQISSVFHNSDEPVIFTTAIDQHASIGIAIANTSTEKTKNRQLTLRLRLEQEEIAQLRKQHQQESDLTAAALKQVEQQTKQLRETMIDLSFILRLAQATTPEEQQSLATAYRNLIERIQPQQQPAAETLVSRPEKMDLTNTSAPDAETIIEQSKKSALIVLPPVKTAVIVHPTLGSTAETALIVHPTLGSTAEMAKPSSPSSLVQPSGIIPTPLEGSSE